MEPARSDGGIPVNVEINGDREDVRKAIEELKALKARLWGQNLLTGAIAGAAFSWLIPFGAYVNAKMLAEVDRRIAMLQALLDQ